MAFSIHTSLDINATPEQVWAVLTDFSSYPSWNPFVKKLKGNIAVGNRFSAEIDGMAFRPKVLAFDKPNIFEWIGHLLVPGLFFDGKHTFQLTEIGPGVTRLEQREEFRGILVPFLKKMILTKTKPGFEALNQALKTRVEQGKPHSV